MTLSKLALAEAADFRTNVLDTLDEVVGNDVDCLSYNTVSVHVTGTHVGTLLFEVSNNGTNWVARTLVGNTGTLASSTTGTDQVWVGDIGARYFRVRRSVSTSGAATVIVIFSSGSTFSPSTGVSGTVSVGGSGASSIAKAEDVAHASGDLGAFLLGVRAPATPIAPTSAAGDYGYIQIDTEGKVVIAGTGDSAQSFQSNTALTTTSDVSLKAAGAAGIRNFVTDVTVENTGAAAVRFLLRDGTTTIWTCTVPANSTFEKSFNTPLKGTAATAINGQLGAAGTATVSIQGYAGV